MKPFTTREYPSLVMTVMTATVLALGLVFAMRGSVVAGNGLFLSALTLCGAVVSGINGFGRRTVTVKSESRRGRGGPQSSVALTS